MTSTTGGHKINRISKETGEIVLSRALDGKTGFFSSIAYGDGKIFVPLEGGVLQAFDAETLTPLWKSKTPTDRDGNAIPQQQSLSSVLYHDGYVYMGVSNGSAKTGAFFCLATIDEDPGSESEEKDFVWSYSPTDVDPDASAGFYWSTGVAVGDYVVFAGEEGVLYSHSLTGTEKDGNGVTVFADSYRLSNAEGASGAEAVRGGVFYDAPTSTVYVNTKAGSVHAVRIDAQTGKFEKESYRNAFLSPDITGTPTAYRGRLYVGGGGISSTSTFAVLDAETLKLLYRTDVRTQSSPIVSTAYATAENNYTVYIYLLGYNNPDGVYIVEDRQGKTQADADAQKPSYFPSPRPQYNSSSVMIDKDGTIFYKNDSGYLFALGDREGAAYTAADVDRAIARLPEVLALTKSDRGELMRVLYRFRSLSDSERALVRSADKLTALSIRLAELETELF